MQVTWQKAFDLWRMQLSENTRRAYLRDLRDLADFLGEPSPLDAVMAVADEDAGGAYFIALSWRERLQQQGKAVSTRNRRLATLKSILKMARAVGLVDYTLGLEAESTGSDQERIREKMIPLDVVARMLELASVRDRALIWLLYCPALRVNEALSLQWPDDVDLARGLVRFLGKQRVEPETHDLPQGAIDAIEAWLSERGRDPGPLFSRRLNRTGKDGKPITQRQAWRIIHDLGEKAGIENACPHGLRHSGITTAARETGGDAFATQQFARHSSVETSTIYIHLSDDERRRTVEAVGAALCEYGTPGVD